MPVKKCLKYLYKSIRQRNEENKRNVQYKCMFNNEDVETVDLFMNIRNRIHVHVLIKCIHGS